MRARIITRVSTELPPCGLYRTVKPIGSIEAGRLVYFHNHGDPGPGLYFPESWSAQPRAVLQERHDRAGRLRPARAASRCPPRASIA